MTPIRIVTTQEHRNLLPVIDSNRGIIAMRTEARACVAILADGRQVKITKARRGMQQRTGILYPARLIDTREEIRVDVAMTFGEATDPDTPSP